MVGNNHVPFILNKRGLPGDFFGGTSRRLWQKMGWNWPCQQQPGSSKLPKLPNNHFEWSLQRLRDLVMGFVFTFYGPSQWSFRWNFNDGLYIDFLCDLFWSGVKNTTPKQQYLPYSLLVGGFNPCEKNTSIWIISPKRGENKTYLKPPPRNNTCHIEMPLTVLTRLVSIHQTQRLAQLSGTPELQICEALHLKAKWKITPLKTNMTGWKTHHEWRCITF